MTRFKANPRFEQELERDPKVRRVLERRAEEAAKVARQIARDHRETGDLEESIQVDGTTLLTTDFAGHIIEYGGANTPPIAPLRKAAEAVGTRVVDG